MKQDNNLVIAPERVMHINHSARWLLLHIHCCLHASLLARMVESIDTDLYSNISTRKGLFLEVELFILEKNAKVHGISAAQYLQQDESLPRNMGEYTEKAESHLHVRENTGPRVTPQPCSFPPKDTGKKVSSTHSSHYPPQTTGSSP